MSPTKTLKYIGYALALLAVITLVIFMGGCQPTPDEDVIGSKNKDFIEEVVDANENNPQIIEESKDIVVEQIKAINQHIDMEFQTSDRTKVVVDAEVYIPSFDKIPLIRSAPENFSIEHLNVFIDYVIGDALIYNVDWNENDFFVKEDFENIITSLKEFALNPNLESHIKSHINDSIERCEENYQQAKTKNERVLFDGTLTPVPEERAGSGYSTLTDLEAYMGSNIPAWLSLLQSHNKLTSQFTYDNHDYGVVYNTFEAYEGVDAPKIDKSYNECKQIAEELIRVIDGDDSNLVLIDSSIAYSIGFFADYTKETSPQGYMFVFAREYNGVVVKPVTTLRTGWDSHIDYSQVVRPEQLIITIDNRGITNFSWISYAQYVETIAEDVPLLDFETIQETFEDFMGYKYAWEPNFDNIPQDATTTITIHTVELNLMMTPEKDNMGNYIIIPVWDFIGDQEYDQVLSAQDGYPVTGEKNVAILTINAIDGTVIDREQGY